MVDDLKSRVLANLPRGKANAITGRELAMKCLCYHTRYDGNRADIVIETRSLRLVIQELIADGYPICSSPGRKADKKTNTPKQEPGYFLAETPAEIKEALVVLRSYGKKIFIHYRDLKRAGQKEFSGQLSLKI